MSQIFAYCQISTLNQTTKNQRQKIKSASFKIKPQQIIKKHISGSAATSKRPSFNRLLARLKCSNQLIVTKLNRLSCNAINIKKTVKQLTKTSIKVHCLALKSINLTSPTKKIIMQVISAVAKFKQNLLLKRTHSKIVKAQSAKKRFSQPPVLNKKQKQVVFKQIKSSVSISAIAQKFKTSQQTILKAKAKLQTPNI